MQKMDLTPRYSHSPNYPAEKPNHKNYPESQRMLKKNKYKYILFKVTRS